MAAACRNTALQVGHMTFHLSPRTPKTRAAFYVEGLEWSTGAEGRTILSQELQEMLHEEWLSTNRAA